MAKIKTVKPTTAAQAFHMEVAALKPKLPKDWKIQLIKILPEYDSYRGGILIHNVINGKSTDTAILAALKLIVEQQNK